MKTNNNIKVAAVIVTYNRKDLLVECIEALLNQTFRCDAIYIIDNASTDGTYERIRKYAEINSIKYFNTGSNLGGAGGFNYGIKQAGSYSYNALWIMDDDTIPTDNALEKLVDYYRNNRSIGYLSSKTIWTDGALCNMNIQRNLDMSRIKDFSSSVIPSGAATFVSLFIPLNIIKSVGLPIKDFFIWGDDLEYTRRISLKYKCFVITESIVVHKMASNDVGNIEVTPDERIDRYKYAYRNEVFLFRREGIKGWVHILLRTPVHIIRVLMKSKSKKSHRIAVILGSTLRGIGFRPEIEYL